MLLVEFFYETTAFPRVPLYNMDTFMITGITYLIWNSLESLLYADVFGIKFQYGLFNLLESLQEIFLPVNGIVRSILLRGLQCFSNRNEMEHLVSE